MRASEPAVINERSRRSRTPLESNASCHALEEHDSAPPLSRAMKKSERLRAFVDQLPKTAAQADLDSRYTGYFACFNSAQYYEAHDVLEDLWLGERGPDYAFFKGLIQFAGAFVHLQKQAARPNHPKDGRRLRPAVRLFELARANLAPFRPRHLRLDVDHVIALADRHVDTISGSDYTENPWHPENAPRLNLA